MEDRERMHAMAASLSAIESNDPATGDQLSRAVAAANEFRLEQGIPALAESAELPEEEFYRRARALGFRRIRR